MNIQLMIMWCQVVRHMKEIAEKILRILLLPITLPIFLLGVVSSYFKKRKKHTPREMFKYIIKKERFKWNRSHENKRCILIVLQDDCDTVRYGTNEDASNPMYYIPFNLCGEQRKALLNDYCPKGATRITFPNQAWHERKNIEYDVSQQREELLETIGTLVDYTYRGIYEQEQDMINNTLILFIF